MISTTPKVTGCFSCDIVSFTSDMVSITLNGIRFFMKQNEFYMWWDKIFPVKMIFMWYGFYVIFMWYGFYVIRCVLPVAGWVLTCGRMSFYLWQDDFLPVTASFYPWQGVYYPWQDKFTYDRVSFTCDKVRSASWESTCRLCCGLHTVIRRLRAGLQSMGSESCNTCFSSNNRTPW